MDSRFEKSLEELEITFTSRLRDHEERLQKALDTPGPIHSDITSLSKEFGEFKCFVLDALGHLKTQAQLLSLGMDRHETAMRRKVLLLHGVPEDPKEKLNITVANILTDKMQLPDVNTIVLEACHRLGSIRGKPRAIVVRFRDMEHRHMVWDNKISLKGTGYTVSEFLTKVRHRVFTAARKHFHMKHVWTAGGTINVITPDKVRHKIESAAELGDLIAKFPNTSDTAAPAQISAPTSSKNARVATAKPDAKTTRIRRRP